MEQGEKLRESFHALLRANFRSGFDPASVIDRKKFARAYCSLHKVASFDADAESLAEEARQSCVTWQGKYYAIDESAPKFLTDLFGELRQQATNLVNINVLFTKNAQELLKLGIISAELFKEFLRKYLHFTGTVNFLRLDNRIDIATEFRRKLAGADYLPHARLAELFPCLTAADAARLAETHLNYKSLRNGDLFLPGAIEFDEAEWQRELAKIKHTIAEQGYFFYSQLDLSKTKENFAEMPESAFVKALEIKLSNNDLLLNGQIISTSTDNNRLSKIIANYCKKQDKFSLSEIQDLFGRFVPSSYVSWLNSICVKNAIQIDYDNFISFKHIIFDIAKIDGIINDLYSDTLFTITSFTHYDILPDIGEYKWNKYILHGYFINFSRKYKFIYPANNRQCIGIVFPRKSDKLSYHEIAAKMAINAGIPVEPEKLTKFLIEHGIYANYWPDAISRIMKIMSR